MVRLLWVTLDRREHTGCFVKVTLTLSHSTNIYWVPNEWKIGAVGQDVGKGADIHWASERACTVIFYAYLSKRYKSFYSEIFSMAEGFSFHASSHCLYSTVSRRIIELSSSMMGRQVTSINIVCYKWERGDWWHIYHVNFHSLIKLLLNTNHVLSTVRTHVSVNATI